MALEIDREKISTPNPTITPQAIDQLRLMLENDWTLEGKVVRISISGKGCDGFDYALGFDHPHAEDFNFIQNQITFAFDPFCAFYAQNLHIDYILDLEKNADGFVIKSHDQKVHSGKFWRQHEDRVPPTKERH
ncbi:MAG: hypothetical protein Fur0010_11940 [Bdellovibrio sp.]